MIIRFTSVMLIVMGIMFFIMAKIIPLFSFLFMDWIGVFSMIGGVIILLVVFPMSDTGKLYDSLPAGSSLIPYIRRDNTVVPLIGRRVFPGESFLEVKGAGIIEDLGVDTVLLWGRKKIRFAQENLNYTPDPRFWNVCRELYRLGFDDEEDLRTILYELPNLDPVKQRMKKAYYLDRMAQIYWNITHTPPKGGEHFVGLLKTFRTKDGTFGRRRHDKPRFEEEPKQKEPGPEAPRKETKEQTVIRKRENMASEEERLKKLLGE